MIDPDMQLSPNFKLKEFLSPDSPELPPGILTNLKRLAQALEGIRQMHGNRPITINSGFRTLAHNEAVGGARNSYHLRGEAADIVVEGVAPLVTQQILKEWHGGLGSYSAWTHVDIRNERARWEGP